MKFIEYLNEIVFEILRTKKRNLLRASYSFPYSATFVHWVTTTSDRLPLHVFLLAATFLTAYVNKFYKSCNHAKKHVGFNKTANCYFSENEVEQEVCA